MRPGYGPRMGLTTTFERYSDEGMAENPDLHFERVVTSPAPDFGACRVAAHSDSRDMVNRRFLVIAGRSLRVRHCTASASFWAAR